jgi:hypothetical protein
MSENDSTQHKPTTEAAPPDPDPKATAEAIEKAEANEGKPATKRIGTAQARRMFQGAGVPERDIDRTIRRVIDTLDPDPKATAEAIAKAEANEGKPATKRIGTAQARRMFQGAGVPERDIDPTIRRVIDTLDGYATVNGVTVLIDPGLDAEAESTSGENADKSL